MILSVLMNTITINEDAERSFPTLLPDDESLPFCDLSSSSIIYPEALPDGSPSRPPTPPNSVCQSFANMSQLELEAFAAVQECARFVNSLYISEVLVRTPELLFLNLVTLEGESHCLELTEKGWRICSDKLDCMYGDFRKTQHHISYYETIYALLNTISPLFCEKFGAALSEELTTKLADRINEK